MKAKPNKAGLVQLLRALGQDIPSVRRARVMMLWQAMGLQWADRHGAWHTAYLYLSTVRPVVQIGRTTVELSPETLAKYGLTEAVEEKEDAPRAAEASTEGIHEDTIMIPQFAALCKG